MTYKFTYLRLTDALAFWYNCLVRRAFSHTAARSQTRAVHSPAGSHRRFVTGPCCSPTGSSHTFLKSFLRHIQLRKIPSYRSARAEGCRSASGAWRAGRRMRRRHRSGTCEAKRRPSASGHDGAWTAVLSRISPGTSLSFHI